MAYQSAKANGSDFAKLAIDVCMSRIHDLMLEDIKNTMATEFYPEQSILACLTCLRLLGQQYPKNLSIAFPRKHFALAKKTFFEWYEKAKKRIPAKYREDLLIEANAEFDRYKELFNYV